jgi:hypothetical protein
VKIKEIEDIIMVKSYSVGEDIEAWCTKCRMELDHTIIAMVDNLPKRVECNTCKGKHNFRVRLSGTGRAKSKGPGRKVRSREARYNEHLSKFTDADLSNAKKYSIRENFKKDEIMNHPSFGIGIVLSIVKTNKVETLFKDGPKLLIQNQE